jgi:nitroimidazol reductase NimA-like FMN-containing flavoprotein (pyridoxamine 5'-phosphate oxidase superfamily)
VEEYIRKKDFGILGSISHDGKPHSTGILYGVSPPGEKFYLYILTGKNYKKAKNVAKNPHVSIVIPFPHHILRFIPAPCIQFQAKAEIIPRTDEKARVCFQRNRILRKTLKQAYENENIVFLKIIPEKIIFGHGIGISMRDLRRDETRGSFKSLIPAERLNLNSKISTGKLD